MVAHYEMMTLKVSDLDRVKIPTFQRGFVWTAKKKNEFIETLHEGLPWNSIGLSRKSRYRVEADSD